MYKWRGKEGEEVRVKERRAGERRERERERNGGMAGRREGGKQKEHRV